MGVRFLLLPLPDLTAIRKVARLRPVPGRRLTLVPCRLLRRPWLRLGVGMTREGFLCTYSLGVFVELK